MLGIVGSLGFKKLLMVAGSLVFMILLNHIPMPGQAKASPKEIHAMANVNGVYSQPQTVSQSPASNPPNPQNGSNVFDEASNSISVEPQYTIIKSDIDSLLERLYKFFTFIAFIGCCYRIAVASVWDNIFLGKREAPIVALVSMGSGIFGLFVGPIVIYVMILAASWIGLPLMK